MYLTKEEERMLNSENETIRKCMEILVAVGETNDAERLVEITSAHISGVSYDNIGDAGLEWLESLDGRVRVPTTLNPAGMDLKRWREMGISEDFYENQMKVLEVFEKLGVEIVLTCTPYYLSRPKFGEHIAWAESSAIVYANSIIGARTNRECGPCALAAAIIGKTPYYGLHIKENRAPTITVKIKGNLAAAGYIGGKELKDEIPYFVFEREVEEWELKLLGAALAASGNTVMFHAEGITPEWEDFEKPSEKIEISGELKAECEPDLITIGCPHTSGQELETILKLLDGRKVKKEFWIFTSRKVFSEKRDVVKKLETLGVKVFNDTCMVVSPATQRFECVMVNSGKAFNYLPSMRKVNVAFGNLKRCVEEAVKG
ncbi:MULTISPECIES: aconitase X catalytic domain-containing protein [unclassified Archaeoglobus]|mgnify:CR=1 FL=1|uniref:aconitase X catalytic domain-containing protein n=1 Tax=unclassified Archaeoglobus TaxID=2643606 RepID=UPI0025BAC949|nr:MULTISPECIES: aconitase X catalytic domain-containing protein [unclassified Archaeoglobus]